MWVISDPRPLINDGYDNEAPTTDDTKVERGEENLQKERRWRLRGLEGICDYRYSHCYCVQFSSQALAKYLSY